MSTVITFVFGCSSMETKPEDNSNLEELNDKVQELTISKPTTPKKGKGRKENTKQLIKDLHARSQLTERVHVAVVRRHREEGFILDAIIYDNSNQEPVLQPQSRKQHEHRIPQSNTPNANPRYVIPAVIKWEKFPRSIQNTPLEDRIQGSAQYFPAYSVVNVRLKQIQQLK